MGLGGVCGRGEPDEGYDLSGDASALTPIRSRAGRVAVPSSCAPPPPLRGGETRGAAPSPVEADEHHGPHGTGGLPTPGGAGRTLERVRIRRTTSGADA